jgi:hypothetical protein
MPHGDAAIIPLDCPNYIVVYAIMQNENWGMQKKEHR